MKNELVLKKIAKIKGKRNYSNNDVACYALTTARYSINIIAMYNFLAYAFDLKTYLYLGFKGFYTKLLLSRLLLLLNSQNPVYY